MRLPLDLAQSRFPVQSCQEDAPTGHKYVQKTKSRSMSYLLYSDFMSFLGRVLGCVRPFRHIAAPLSVGRLPLDLHKNKKLKLVDSCEFHPLCPFGESQDCSCVTCGDRPDVDYLSPSRPSTATRNGHVYVMWPYRGCEGCEDQHTFMI